MMQNKAKKQIQIFRPEPVVVEIDGQEHRLRLFSRGDILDILQILVNSGFAMKDGIVANFQEASGKLFDILSGCDKALDIALKRSFPDVDDWESIPVAGQMQLLRTIWDANDIPGMLETFFALMPEEAKAKATKKPGIAGR
jgi:hypothetical protein